MLEMRSRIKNVDDNPDLRHGATGTKGTKGDHDDVLELDCLELCLNSHNIDANGEFLYEALKLTA